VAASSAAENEQLDSSGGIRTLLDREDNYACQNPERITRHKRTMHETNETYCEQDF
jgi:hypothetical protein